MISDYLLEDADRKDHRKTEKNKTFHNFFQKEPKNCKSSSLVSVPGKNTKKKNC